MSYFRKYLNLILEEKENQQIIVYLDMDGVLADFGGMKKKIITDINRNDFLDLIKHLELNSKEKEEFLNKISGHSQDSSILDEKEKPKFSKTSIKRGEGRFWKILNSINFFEKLEPLEDNELIKKINELKKQYNFKLGILGSTGDEESFDNFKQQKMKWLKNHNLLQYLDLEHIIFVPGKRFKKNYANSNSILIDDTEVNVRQFKDNGGHSILHKNINQTLKELETFLEKSKK
jgi:hypothetical protein